MIELEHSLSPNLQPLILLYGPPGSGKSAAGLLLANDLEVPFFDLDVEIEKRSGMSVPEIFSQVGEPGFREIEAQALAAVLSTLSSGVISLGGGALLNPDNRSLAERSGSIVCLTARQEILLERLLSTPSERPLLSESLEVQLERILNQRRQHYDSFSHQLDTADRNIEDVSLEIQALLGRFHVTGMGPGYDVRVKSGNLTNLGRQLQEIEMLAPIALVTDEHVWKIYGRQAIAALENSGYEVHPCVIQPGEANKDIQTLNLLWESFLRAGLERRSVVIALGGGVIGDLAGFAAATYLRGIRWVSVPTSLLAMVDASLGGKTGIDLPQGKNLAGAFHAPGLVLVDPDLLRTLPEAEMRNGMAEVLKHGVIGDEKLFDLCESGWKTVLHQLDVIVKRAIAVKIRLIKSDPFEKGPRAALNLGHTLGHALEQVSEYRLKHGEAVAIGMVAVARLAEKLTIADPGLSEGISQALSGLGLPTRIPKGFDPAELEHAMRYDKKRRHGAIRLVLPVRIGQVITGFELSEVELLFNE